MKLCGCNFLFFILFYFIYLFYTAIIFKLKKYNEQIFVSGTAILANLRRPL